MTVLKCQYAVTVFNFYLTMEIQLQGSEQHVLDLHCLQNGHVSTTGKIYSASN